MNIFDYSNIHHTLQFGSTAIQEFGSASKVCTLNCTPSLPMTPFYTNMPNSVGGFISCIFHFLLRFFPTEQKLVISPIQLYHGLVAGPNFLQQNCGVCQNSGTNQTFPKKIRRWGCYCWG